ncbi:MAG: helix-turn-helix domain-containing protein [Verrucomicrobia bacterium]|nr:helix-turn-helix domain-containing protein [Verrucomicrobiota bacterium]MCH8526450.1 helix-turn-helix domain-containing protein [Kiritimatiellia bacterium]
METLGTKLRIAREAKGLSVSELGQLTRIKSQQIEGMERDDFSKIPAPMYVKGFIKLCAQALDMEPDPLLALYEQQINETRPSKPTVRETKVLRPAPVPEPSPEKVPEPGELRRRAGSLRPSGSIDTPRSKGPPLSERLAAFREKLPPMPDVRFTLPETFWHREAPAAGAVLLVVVLLFTGIRSCSRADRAPLQDEAGAVRLRQPFLLEPSPVRFSVPEPSE